MIKFVVAFATAVACALSAQAQTLMSNKLFLVDPTTGYRLTLETGPLTGNVTATIPATGGTLLTAAGGGFWSYGGDALTGGGPTTPNELLGSTNNYDVVFQSNGAERLRLAANGDIIASGLSLIPSQHIVGVDANGKLSRVFADTVIWKTSGNVVGTGGVGFAQEYLGTNNAQPLVLATTALERMRITPAGHVTIGGATTSPAMLRISSGITSGNAIQLEPWGVAAGNTGEFRLQELAANGTDYVAIKAPDIIGTSLTFTMPSTAPVVNQVLTATAVAGGAVSLGWSAPSTGGAATYKKLTADVDNTSDAVWVEATGLTTAVAASTSYEFHFILLIKNKVDNRNTDLRLTFPAGAEIAYEFLRSDNGSRHKSAVSATSPTEFLDEPTNNSDDRVWVIKGVLQNGVTPGDLKVEFKRHPSPSGTNSIRTGSRLTLRQ